MRRIRRPTRLILIRDHPTPIRNNQPIDQSPKMFQRCLGLIIRRLMARIIQPQKAKIPILPNRAVLLPINQKGRVVARAKFVRGGMVHLEGDGFATEPVADVVGVAVDEGCGHAAVDDAFEVGFEVGEDEVACERGQSRVGSFPYC